MTSASVSESPKVLLRQCGLRERAILALMAYGGLRRGEVAALDVGDVAPDFGLRRVMGKGGHEVPVALPAPARAILRDYMVTERAGLPASAQLFVVTYKHRVGQRIERRITGQRIWKVVKAIGAQARISLLHPHALRHACGVELPRRTKNLRVGSCCLESVSKRDHCGNRVRSPPNPRRRRAPTHRTIPIRYSRYPAELGGLKG
jgi:site-specific recombinase XerD